MSIRQRNRYHWCTNKAFKIYLLSAVAFIAKVAWLSSDFDHFNNNKVKGRCEVHTPLTEQISDDSMFGADISLGWVVLGAAAAAAIMVACSSNKAQPWLPVPNCGTLVRADGGLSNRTNKSACD